MSWGRSLMGKQWDYKNCWGLFGCIDENRLLSFLIVCRHCKRAAAMLTWGLPALGCSLPFSPALVAAAVLLSLLLLLFSLSSSLYHLSLFFCWKGRAMLPFVSKKASQKEGALFCGSTLAIFFALHQILFRSCHQKNHQCEMCSSIALSAESYCLFCVWMSLLSLHIHQAHACVSLEKR